MCGDRPWKLCDTKVVSFIYLSLGMEGCQIFGSQEPTIQIDQILTNDFWESLNNVFTKQRIITFKRYTLSTRKQLKRELVEKFYGCLRELSLNCDCASHVECVIRNVFIANMKDGEMKRELLKEVRSAKKALEVAVKI